MSDKTAIIFDTNFIIAHMHSLIEVHQKLSETFEVYVSDISIQERLSQKYLEMEGKYAKLNKFKSDFAYLANIEIKRTFEQQVEIDRKHTRKGYTDLFGDNIIPFEPDAELLKTVMDRVYKKIPPFINAENASDKGFKDTLLWLSLLGYFKDRGNESVIFITNDKGFQNNADALCKEFCECTGKIIEIQGNSFYDDYVKKDDGNDVQTLESPSLVVLSDFSILRERINDVITPLCLFECENNFGDTWLEQRFISHQVMTPERMKCAFESLRHIMTQNLFERELPPHIVFTAISDIESKYSIEMDVLQNALSLYEEMSVKFPDYLPQFFSAASTIFNKNYQEARKTNISSDDDDLPF